MTATLGTDCGCGCGGSSDCGSTATAAGERTRYYPRQLVGAADLTQDQLYFREKARRHNRLLHGWGIVCGAEVKVSAKAGCVDVNTGYILGPYGDEILLDEVVTVDLSSRNADGDATNGCIPPDPWCAEVKVAPAGDQPVYLAIAHAEFPCSPVQVATSGCGCGCDETACEYSRWRDSYRIRILDTLPATYTTPMTAPSPAIAFSCRSDFVTTNALLARQLQMAAPAPAPAPADASACNCPQCTPCPSSPWVILADITVNGDKITIDCNAHRRYVASFRDYFYMCRSAVANRPKLTDVLDKAGVKALGEKLENIPAAVVALPAKNLAVTVAANSALGKKIEGLTVADVAATSRDAFVADAASGVAADQRVDVAEKAGQIWEKAVAAKSLADGL